MKIKKCPAISPRQPDDDRFPDGYLESTDEFIDRNIEWLDWCENNAELIRMLPDIINALENRQAAETILEKIKKLSKKKS